MAFERGSRLGAMLIVKLRFEDQECTDVKSRDPPPNRVIWVLYMCRAPFMTDEMWSAWLSNPEFAPEASRANLEAQRDFAAWWILHGKQQYPKTWSINDAILEIGLEDRLVFPAVSMPRVLAFIYENRKDLQEAFPIPPLRNVVSLVNWYTSFAPQEYPFAPSLPRAFLKKIASKDIDNNGAVGEIRQGLRASSRASRP